MTAAADQVSSRPVKRPRHLMDPNNLVRPVNDRRLSNVQRWVMSVLVVFTVAHLAIGIVIAAVMISTQYEAARVGLCLIAGAFGVLGLVAGFLVHRRSPLNAWLPIGLVPGIVGLVLVTR